ncbi:hypothetical protein BH23GEM6_BH23GEM6_12570 [soil metagenome]
MSVYMAALFLLQTSAETRAAGGLGPFAWVFMLGSMGAVTTLAVWCFTRVLTTRKHFDPDGTGPARPPVVGEVEQKKRDDEI